MTGNKKFDYDSLSPEQKRKYDEHMKPVNDYLDARDGFLTQLGKLLGVPDVAKKVIENLRRKKQ